MYYTLIGMSRIQLKHKLESNYSNEHYQKMQNKEQRVIPKKGKSLPQKFCLWDDRVTILHTDHPQIKMINSALDNKLWYSEKTQAYYEADLNMEE